MTPEQRQTQIELGRKLLVHGWVCWAHDPEGPEMFVCTMQADGMIELAGWSGSFAPSRLIPAPKSVADFAAEVKVRPTAERINP